MLEQSTSRRVTLTYYKLIDNSSVQSCRTMRTDAKHKNMRLRAHGSVTCAIASVLLFDIVTCEGCPAVNYALIMKKICFNCPKHVHAVVGLAHCRMWLVVAILLVPCASVPLNTKVRCSHNLAVMSQWICIYFADFDQIARTAWNQNYHDQLEILLLAVIPNHLIHCTKEISQPYLWLCRRLRQQLPT